MNIGDVIRWRCDQLLPRDFMVYKMTPSVRASDLYMLSAQGPRHTVTITEKSEPQISELWVKLVSRGILVGLNI